MKTWEQFQARRKVGKIREKLAEMIEAAVPGVALYPEDLQQQNPAFSRPEVDACTWDAWGENKQGQPVHFYSWSSMGSIVRAENLTARPDGPNCYEIDPLELTPGAELAELNEMDAKHPGWDANLSSSQ